MKRLLIVLFTTFSTFIVAVILFRNVSGLTQLNFSDYISLMKNLHTSDSINDLVILLNKLLGYFDSNLRDVLNSIPNIENINFSNWNNTWNELAKIPLMVFNLYKLIYTFTFGFLLNIFDIIQLIFNFFVGGIQDILLFITSFFGVGGSNVTSTSLYRNYYLFNDIL